MTTVTNQDKELVQFIKFKLSEKKQEIQNMSKNFANNEISVVDFAKNIANDSNNLKELSKKLAGRGPDFVNYLFKDIISDPNFYSDETLVNLYEKCKDDPEFSKMLQEELERRGLH